MLCLKVMLAIKVFFSVLSLQLNFKRRFGSAFPLTPRYDVTFSVTQHIYFHMRFSDRQDSTQPLWEMRSEAYKATSSLNLQEEERERQGLRLKRPQLAYYKLWISSMWRGGGSLSHLCFFPRLLMYFQPFPFNYYNVGPSQSMCFLFNTLAGMRCAWHESTEWV